MENTASSSVPDWKLGKEALTTTMPHHESLQSLWELKWKRPCTLGVYPFHDGHYEDFEPVFQALIRDNVSPFDPQYTNTFIHAAQILEDTGDTVLQSSASNEARDAAVDLYLRSAALLRIGRFPYVRNYPRRTDKIKNKAWQKQKLVYEKAGSLWDNGKLQRAHVLFDHTSSFPLYIRLPSKTSATRDRRPPVMVILTGLDGYRTDNTERSHECIKRGWAVVILEIPGTADCPADPFDPTSTDHLWDRLLKWLQRESLFDMTKIMVWGLSAGGYYAIRAAHTQNTALHAVVAQGAGAHWFFHPQWLEHIDKHEYPFALLPLLAEKHGYANAEAYKKDAIHRFSLLETGILDKPCCKLLLVNGTQDGLMPIEDSELVARYGRKKEVETRFFPGLQHMGYPTANRYVYPWLERSLGVDSPDPA